MHFKSHIKASVLPTVIVVCTLMLLIVFSLLSYSEIGALMQERAMFKKNCQADIESAFILYENYPDVVGEIRLYDSIPSSSVVISHKMWGLYEAVSVTHTAGETDKTNLMGLQSEPNSKTLYYANGSTPLTITGATNLIGDVAIPSGGVIYGRSGATFFSGATIDKNRITLSENRLPASHSDREREINVLLESDYSTAQPLLGGDSLNVNFYNTKPLIVSCRGTLNGELLGNIVVRGDEVKIDPLAKLTNVLIAARKVIVGEKFRGNVQIFASDTIIVEKNAVLEYPSGIYASKYIELKDGSIVNGYVIENSNDGNDVSKPNYRQSRLAKVRGLVYLKGNAMLQGIVSGMTYGEKAVYYSPQGYWKDMLLDFTTLQNEDTAHPIWLSEKRERKKIVWLD